MSFIVTTAVKKLMNVGGRVRVIQGGTSAGKTYGILPILIQYATIKPGTEISVVSETMPHLRKGAMRDFIKVMKTTGRFIPEHWNKSTSTYIFSNESYIEFFSADSQDKVRGPRRDILYVNECNNIDFETYSQLAIRTRRTIWIDYNPTCEFWANTELNDEDTERIILTYKDNETLTDTIVHEIEKVRTKAFYDENTDELFKDGNIRSSYWANWWKVYGLGLAGTLDGVIFTNWSIVKCIPSDARLLGYGIDFGYTNDPTTIIALYRYDGHVYWRELCYKKGMKNKDIADELKRLSADRYSLIVADCAEPKSIAEINEFGFSVVPCEKGNDSIRYGIDLLLSQNEMYVTEDSTNTIDELRKYMWEKDKSGATTNRPIGAYDHTIDAMRYIACRTLSNQAEMQPINVEKLNEIFF